MPREDQVRGYQIGKDEYVVFEPEEIAAVVPQSDKTLRVSAFVNEAEVDDVYFDRPYYLAPADRSATEAFGLIHEGLVNSRVVAIAEAVLFRRVRTVLVRAYGTGSRRSPSTPTTRSARRATPSPTCRTSRSRARC